MKRPEILIAILGGATLSTATVFAQGGSVPVCFRLEPAGTCGMADEEETDSIECCDRWFPAWVVTPGTVHLCGAAVGAGEDHCTESVEDECTATIQNYEGCDGCFPDPKGSEQPYGPGEPSARLDGEACEGSV